MPYSSGYTYDPNAISKKYAGGVYGGQSQYQWTGQNQNPQRQAAYQTAMTGVGTNYGQRRREMEAAGAERAGQYGMTGPQGFSQNMGSLFDALSRERLGVQQSYLEQEGAAAEAERQREFENLMQGFRGQQALEQQGHQLGFDYMRGEGGLTPWEMKEQADRDRMALDTFLKRKLIRAEQGGEGNITDAEWQILEDQYGISRPDSELLDALNQPQQPRIDVDEYNRRWGGGGGGIGGRW